MVLAQIDPGVAADGLAKNPLAWGLVLAILAIGFLYRELSAARSQLIETIKSDAKEQQSLLAQIVPLSSKLTEGLESLERLTDALTKGTK